jgi:hypothetical protein
MILVVTLPLAPLVAGTIVLTIGVGYRLLLLRVESSAP